ncbi:unnamed protein product [Gongylonema pulchrum]|uniref:Transposase n=1 Tax=Gongylonema pulchrum TaxID=637853 RepID=A0A183DEP8_9BILA|nr:unnamed protein product [Gongylonema pulchrum]
MHCEDSVDLVTHLLAENRKLRQLYLAEHQKATVERRRRITAEARLAALLSLGSVERRRPNEYVVIFSFFGKI